jgi:hypothetical protein
MQLTPDFTITLLQLQHLASASQLVNSADYRQVTDAKGLHLAFKFRNS